MVNHDLILIRITDGNLAAAYDMNLGLEKGQKRTISGRDKDMNGHRKGSART